MAINSRQQEVINSLQTILNEWEAADDLLGAGFYNSMQTEIATLNSNINLRDNLSFLILDKVQDIFDIIKNLRDVD
jgi:uncharacterized membrane protein affecting hemolysin expression